MNKINPFKYQIVNWIQKLGFFALFRWLNKNKLRVLLYHRFSDKRRNGFVSSATLRNQILYIKQAFQCFSPDELFRLSIAKKNGVVITVDDGYRDFYINAYPILREFGVSAIVFLTSDFIDGKTWLWFDKFDYIMQKACDRNFPFPLIDNNILFREEDAQNMLESLKKIGPQEIEASIMELSSSLCIHLPETPPEDYAPLTWDQIREMSKNGIAFGSHTCTHPILTHSSSERVFSEINTSKERIEAELGKPVVSFAYPNGDYNEKIVQMVREAGYEYAFTTRYGFVSLKDSRFTLNRMAIGDRPLIYFRQDLSGIDILKESTRRFFRLNR